MDATGRQVPLRQHVDEPAGRKVVCNRVVREHRKPGTMANGFAHGERGIQKNRGLNIHRSAFDLVERKIPTQRVTQGGVGDEG